MRPGGRLPLEGEALAERQSRIRGVCLIISTQ